MGRGHARGENGSGDKPGRRGVASSSTHRTRARGAARTDSRTDVRDGEERSDSSSLAGASAPLRAERDPRLASDGWNSASRAGPAKQQSTPSPEATGSIARKPTARAERLSARRRSAAHRALATLSNLPEMLTPQALERPYRFLAEFAAAHELPVELGTEQYERDPSLHPDHRNAWRLIQKHGTIKLDCRLSLSPMALDRLRRLVVELGCRLDGRTPEAWTPQERAEWCLVPTGISGADLNEVCAVAAAVADRLAYPERALARHRSRLPLEDTAYRDPTISGLDPPPVPNGDQQAIRLRLLSEIAFAPPYRTTEWMVRWAFHRHGRRRPHFTKTIIWLRQGVDKLAALAQQRVRDAARGYRDRFFAGIDPRTCPVPDSTFNFWRYGYGEVGDPVMEARVAEQARAFPEEPIDHVKIALAGNAEALYAALREAGTAALRWPWVLRILDGWRAAVEASIEPHRDEARERMRGIGAALMHITGKGLVARPDRTASRIEAVKLLCSYFEAYLGDSSTPIPRRLLEIGDLAHKDREARASIRERGHRYTRLDEAAILAARRRVTRPGHALRVARDVVSAAFAVARSTVVRET